MINAHKHKQIHLIAIFVFLCIVLTTSVLGADQASCTIDYSQHAVIFKDTQVKIYQFATMDSHHNYEIHPDFEPYNLAIQDDMANSHNLSQTISGYVAFNHMAPYRTEQINEEGYLTATQLPQGIYWVEGADVVVDGAHYMVQPSLFALPYKDENGEYINEITILPKIIEPETPPTGTAWRDLTVQKLWDDNNYEANRPEEIEVALLRNDTVYDTVILNSECNWRHTWSQLDKSYQWQVAEVAVPEEYAVSVAATANGYWITNTYQKDPEDPKNPGDPDEDIDTSTTPDPNAPQPSLPYTGLLVWPIPILMCFGIVFIMGGRAIRRKEAGLDNA